MGTPMAAYWAQSFGLRFKRRAIAIPAKGIITQSRRWFRRYWRNFTLYRAYNRGLTAGHCNTKGFAVSRNDNGSVYVCPKNCRADGFYIGQRTRMRMTIGIACPAE
jgi:hypothetical protein